MEEFDDYPVTPRTDEDLERFADEIRKRLGFSSEDTPTALELLAALRQRHGVEVVVRPDGEMGRKEAYVISDPSRVFLRDSTYEAVKKDEPRAIAKRRPFGAASLMRSTSRRVP